MISALFYIRKFIQNDMSERSKDELIEAQKQVIGILFVGFDITQSVQQIQQTMKKMTFFRLLSQYLNATQPSMG